MADVFIVDELGDYIAGEGGFELLVGEFAGGEDEVSIPRFIVWPDGSVFGTLRIISLTQKSDCVLLGLTDGFQAEPWRCASAAEAKGVRDAYARLLEAAFTVVPTIASISPTSGNASPDVEITLTGTNYLPGFRITVGGVELSGLVYVSATSVKGTLTNFALAVGGPYAVVYTGPDGQTATLAAAYTVNSATAPTITSVYPTSSSSAQPLVTVNLTGTNFAPTGFSITIGGVALINLGYTSETGVYGDLQGGTLAPGDYDVVYTGPDAQTATSAGAGYPATGYQVT